ncbi:MAG TPA: hypothetical protein VFH23_02670 [Jiangellaceae bacterium]|nr:hypothetical protein [Jiangellaceae bacterium]
MLQLVESGSDPGNVWAFGNLGDLGGLGQQGVELVEEFGAGGVVEPLEFSMCVLDAAG